MQSRPQPGREYLARLCAASPVNAELSGLYWQAGQRIHREVPGSRRARYGEEIVSTLSSQLSADYGRGFWRGCGHAQALHSCTQALKRERLMSTTMTVKGHAPTRKKILEALHIPSSNGVDLAVDRAGLVSVPRAVTRDKVLAPPTSTS